MTVVVSKLSVSLSAELASAVRGLAKDRGDDLSPLIETLLRENWLVAERIQAERAGPGAMGPAETQRLIALGRAADAQWRRRLQEGSLEEPR